MSDDFMSVEYYKAEIDALKAQAEATAAKSVEAAKQQAADDLVDFDAYWETVNRKGKSVKIHNRVWHLPPSLPLQFELEANKLAKSQNDDDVKKLVAILFGDEAFAQFAADGMDIDEFQVLLAWAPQVISGRNVSIGEVAAELAELTGDDSPGEA